MHDPHIPRTLKISERQSEGLVSLIKLAGTFARRPAWFEGRDRIMDFIAVYTVTPLIGPRPFGKGYLAARYGLHDDIGQVAHLIILFGPAYVKRLIVDPVLRGFQ